MLQSHKTYKQHVHELATFPSELSHLFRSSALSIFYNPYQYQISCKFGIKVLKPNQCHFACYLGLQRQLIRVEAKSLIVPRIISNSACISTSLDRSRTPFQAGRDRLEKGTYRYMKAYCNPGNTCCVISDTDNSIRAFRSELCQIQSYSKSVDCQKGFWFQYIIGSLSG